LSHAQQSPGRRGRFGLAMVLGLVLALGLTLPGAAAAKGKQNGHQLTVMTRNLYLGADLSPALESSSLDGAVNAAFQIEQQVHATKFPSVRAALLANEIKKQKPDIVGLQEAAWWRTGPYDPLAAINGPKATQTDAQGGDFLTDLLTQLNMGSKRVVWTGAPPGGLLQAHDVRLLLLDLIGQQRRADRRELGRMHLLLDLEGGVHGAIQGAGLERRAEIRPQIQVAGHHRELMPILFALCSGGAGKRQAEGKNQPKDHRQTEAPPPARGLLCVTQKISFRSSLCAANSAISRRVAAVTEISRRTW